MVLMIIIPVFLGLIGLAFGSFVGALVWRLHEHKDFVSDRSECEHCHHKLGPLDLIPLFSWLALRGKCRYCHKPIGWTAPLLEISMAVLFVGSYYVWPLDFTTWQANLSFGLWLVYLVGLVALLVYDLKWMLLPNVLVFPLMGVAVVESAIRYSVQVGVSPIDYLNSVIFGIIALGGLYWALYTFSKGKWVGYGDVKLGVFMGIALGFQRSILALFLANIVGFLVVLPGLMIGKLKRTSRVPFGPFLIVAFILAFLFGDRIIDWYLSFISLR
jgi:prepilin signal peptidase PulO-like enzyme (type II secretory pathway)